MKTCSLCGETKDESEFYVSGRRCKECQRAKARERARERKAYNDDLMDPIGEREITDPLSRRARAQESIDAYLRRLEQ